MCVGAMNGCGTCCGVQVEGGGQTEGVWVFPATLGPGCQAWRDMPLPAEPSLQPYFGFLFKNEKQTKTWTVVKE